MMLALFILACLLVGAFAGFILGLWADARGRRGYVWFGATVGVTVFALMLWGLVAFGLYLFT